METHYHQFQRLEDRLLLAAAPVVDSVSYLSGSDGRISGIVVNFSEDLSNSLDNTDLILVNQDTTNVVDTSASDLIVSGNVATWSFASFAGGSLDDGSYLGTLVAIGIYNDQLQFLDGDANGTGGDNYSFTFDSFASASVGGNVYGDVNSDSVYSALVDHPMDSWRVYIDANANDSYDDGEVYTLTDSDGAWQLGQLEPGDYRIGVELEVGFVSVTPVGSFYDFTLESGQSLIGQDFIVKRPNSISGVIYQDLNEDGSRGENEDGLADWIVYIDTNVNLQYDVGERQAITDSNGRYYFDSVVAGSHMVTALPADNWSVGNPVGGSYFVGLIEGNAVDHCNFAALAGASSISGTIFEDVDGDGVFDIGEIPLSGWAVFIDADSDGVFDFDETWTVTDSQGQYIFENVEPADYVIAAATQAGWDRTTPIGTLGGQVTFVQVLNDATPGLSELDRSAMTVVSPDGAHVYSAVRGSGDWYLYSFAVSSVDSRLTLVQQLSETQYDCINTVSDIVFSPDGNFVYVTASNNSAVGVFSRNILTGELTHIETISSDSLSAASAAIFDSSGEFLYVTAGTSNSLVVFSRNVLTGGLTEIQSISDGQLGADALAGAADIEISPDDRFIYVAAALDEAVGIFSRDPVDGTVSYAGTVSEDDAEAGCFGYVSSLAVSPDGEYLYAVAAGDACLSVFSRDQITGALQFEQIFRDGSGSVAGIDYATHVTVSSDGRQILVAGSLNYAFAEFSRDGDSHSFVTAIADDYADSIIPDRRTVEFSPNGRTLFLSGMSGSTIMVYEYDVHEAHLAQLDHGEVISNLDIGFAAQSSGIFGMIWLDADNDKVKDAGEPGLSGWTVYVEYGSAKYAAITDAGGNYSFGGLSSGVHLVKIDMPDGWINTSPGGAAQIVTLTVGTETTGVDFAAMMPSSISGHIFEDADRDGIFDVSEGDLSGVTVFIDSNSNGIADAGERQVFSDILGNFVFENLVAGSYRIGVVYENGLIASSPIGGSYTVTLATGQNVDGYEFGAYRLGSISGTVWQDINGDASIDAGESPLENWEVFVDLDGDTYKDASEPSVFSDVNGYYEFSNLVPGNYTVRLVVQDGWRTVSTIGDSRIATITSGSSASQTNFALAEPVTISGKLWHDSNGDGIVDEGEAPLGGWRVFLDEDGDGVFDTGETESLTDENGGYLFNSVDPGEHTISVEMPENWWATVPHIATETIIAASGSIIENQDFGFRPGMEYDRSSKLKYTDPSGVKIVVAATRTISGRLYFDPEGYVVELEVLTGNVLGEVRVDIYNAPDSLLLGAVTIDEDIKSFIAPSLGLADGTLASAGELRKLVLGDIQNSSIVIASGTAGAVSENLLDIRLGRLQDVSIDTSSQSVDEFTATEWLDTDEVDDLLKSPNVNKLLISGARETASEAASAGNMQADLLIGTDGSIGDVLGRAAIAGQIACTWTILGDIGTITLGDADQWTLEAAGSADSINAGSFNDTIIDLTGTLGNVKAKSWLGGLLGASAIGDMQITGDKRNDIAGDIQIDIDVTGQASVFGDFAGRRILVADNILGGQWEIGDSVLAIIVSGDINQLELIIGGNLDSLLALQVTDSDVGIAGSAGKIVVSDYTGGSLAADSINELITKGEKKREIVGDFSADLTLAADSLESGVPAAKNINIAGNLLDSAWQIGADVLNVVISGDISNMVWAVDGNVKNIKAGSISDTELAATGEIGNLTAKQWQAGSLSADSMKDLKITGNKKAEIDGDFTPDFTLTGENISADADIIRQVVIPGAVDSSTWQIAGSLLLIRIGKAVNSWNLVLGGDLNHLLAGDVAGSNLDVTGEIKLFKADSFLDGQLSAESLAALQLGSRSTRGAAVLNSNITIDGEDGTLGNAVINGDVSGGTWDIGQLDTGIVNILGDVDSLAINSGDIKAFAADLVSNTSINSTGEVGPIVADQWQTGQINADSLRSLKITGNKREEIAGDLTADMNVAGENIDEGKKVCGDISVAGSVTDSIWNIDGQMAKIVIKGSSTNLEANIDGDALNISVLGSAIGVRLLSSGKIDSVLLGACVGSDFLVGVDLSFEGRHVNYSSDFANPDSFIKNVKILGIKDGQTTRFISDSNFSAPVIRNVIVRNTDDELGPVTFYVDNDGIQSNNVRYIDNQLRSRWDWRPLGRRTQPEAGNIVWHPVGQTYYPVLSDGTLIINEGSTTTFTVKLSADPVVETVVDISKIAGEDDVQIQGSSQLVFDATNWNVAQTVTIISGEDSDTLNGITDFEISADGGSHTASLRVTENDDDQPFALVLSSSTLDVTEGAAAQVSLSLSSAPLGVVVASVSYTSGDSDINVTFGSMVVFDWSNWNTPQVILFSAALDADSISGSTVFTISALGAESYLTLTVNEIDID